MFILTHFKSYKLVILSIHTNKMDIIYANTIKIKEPLNLLATNNAEWMIEIKLLFTIFVSSIQYSKLQTYFIILYKQWVP